MVEKSLPTMTLHSLDWSICEGCFILSIFCMQRLVRRKQRQMCGSAQLTGLQSVASVSINTAYSLQTLHQQYSLGMGEDIKVAYL